MKLLSFFSGLVLGLALAWIYAMEVLFPQHLGTDFVTNVVCDQRGEHCNDR